jgi:hypothetical protein
MKSGGKGVIALWNDYIGPDGVSGFRKETNDKIGNRGGLLNQRSTLVDSINSVYAAANAELMLEDETEMPR